MANIVIYLTLRYTEDLLYSRADILVFTIWFTKYYWLKVKPLYLKYISVGGICDWVVKINNDFMFIVLFISQLYNTYIFYENIYIFWHTLFYSI